MNRTHAVSQGVRQWAGGGSDRQTWILECLGRHYGRDWGDIDRSDWAANDRSISLRAGRLLSAYPAPAGLAAPDGQFWIITDELDDPDTVTTILWPSEY